MCSPSPAKLLEQNRRLVFTTGLLVLISFVSGAPSNPTVVTTNMRGQGTNGAPKETAMYIRVMQKMDDFCGKPYRETDDRQIESYSKCFSQLIKADPEVVRNCRSKVFGSNRQLKAADCERSGSGSTFASKSQEIRTCITLSMRRKSPNYTFAEDEDEAVLRSFLSCMDSVF